MMTPSVEIPFSALKLGQELGRGSFGTVYQGTYQYNDVAIKQLILGKLNQETLEEFQNESKNHVEHALPAHRAAIRYMQHIAPVLPRDGTNERRHPV